MAEIHVDKEVVVLAVVSEDNELIPIWDKRLRFEDDEDYGKVIYIQGGYSFVTKMVEVVYDLETHTLTPGISVDYYPPNNKKMDFIKGQSVYYEVSGKINTFKESVIKDIIFEDFEVAIIDGNDVLYYYSDGISKDLEIDPKKLYMVKMWKPCYVMADGTKIKWSYQLKFKEPQYKYKKGDIVVYPSGLSLIEREVFEDERGPYVLDHCGGDSDKRHIYVSEHDGWDTSLIREFGLRLKK